MKTLVIQNPYSSRWKSSRRQEDLKNALADAGIQFDLVVTEEQKHATELSKKGCLEGYDTIIAAGGDGTIGEVINGIMSVEKQGKLPNFGIMPLGTANDLAANLGISDELTQAAKTIAAGKTKKLDIGEVNGRYFINNSGLGLEPYTTVLQEKMTKVPGTPRYMLAVFGGIIKNKQWVMQIEWDGGSFEGPTTLVSVGNGARTGGFFYTVPHADPTDGKLSFVHGYIPTRAQILKVLPMTMKPAEGNYVEHPAVHEIHCTWLKVHVEPGTPAHTDGELFATSIHDLEYKILPARIPILINE